MMQPDLQPFIDAGFDVSYDPPEAPHQERGLGWIDLTINGNIISSIAFWPPSQYGIYDQEPDEILYGEPPSEVLFDAETAAKRIKDLLTADYDWTPSEAF